MSYKIIFQIFLFLLLEAAFGYSQSLADSLLIKKFEDSFTFRIIHPVKLYAKCVPVMCMLKIDINANAKVATMELSDSADSLFIKEFNINKNRINLDPLEKYCNQNYLKNKILIIPIYYSFPKTICPLPIIDFNLLAKYNVFHGQSLNKEINFLPAIALQSTMHDY